jgi:5-methylcytosine-specific restriction endonuclease McrA
MAKSISDLIMQFFMNHPNRPLKHGPVVDWVTDEYLKTHKKPPRDPWRAIRSLHQQGKLIKVEKGVYMYDPDFVHNVELEDFTQEQKQEIFKRDNFCCVICGMGPKDGISIHADHLVPKDKGGKATIDNGQTLCSIHNFRKKNYSQTESGKRMFIRLHEKAKAINDLKTMRFCEAILETYEQFGINGHINWNKDE